MYADVPAGARGDGKEMPGRTRLRSLRHRTPLQLGRLLYPDESLPDMAFLYVATLGGGLVGGDRLSIRLSLEPGARAHVTTLAATKIYGRPARPPALAAQHSPHSPHLLHSPSPPTHCPVTDHAVSDFSATGPPATGPLTAGTGQTVALTVAAGTVLEWWPDPLIPFREARFRQDVTLTVAPDAILLFGDLLLPGRIARGERHAYAALASRVTARRPDGGLLFADHQALAPTPPGAPPLAEALPPGRDTCGTVYALAPAATLPALSAALACAATSAGDGVLAGASLLPHGCGVALRLLAPDGLSARRAMHRAWTAARRTLLDAPPPELRKL